MLKTIVFGVLVLALAACGAKGPNAMRDYLSRDGVWGWDDGAGCDGLANAWTIEGKNLEMFRDGRLVDRALLEKRTPLYGNRLPEGSGSIEFARWTFIAQNPNDRSRLGRQEIMFAIRGGPGRPTALVPRGTRPFVDSETGEKTTFDEPLQGGRLVHCDEVGAPN